MAPISPSGLTEGRQTRSSLAANLRVGTMRRSPWPKCLTRAGHAAALIFDSINAARLSLSGS
ncbi:MAG TPA: hypothetical protein VGD96_04720, partial [Bradyrhizobium sp.]